MSEEASGSYGHQLVRMGPNSFCLIWTFDRKLKDAEETAPVERRRMTDLKGAQRFASRWALAIPTDTTDDVGRPGR